MSGQRTRVCAEAAVETDERSQNGRRRSLMTTGRLEAFSDGVFAIAATLLILEVRVAGEPLSRAIVNAWPRYAGYAVSFLSIGVMWVNHHVVMHQIARVDRALLMLNTVLLMLVGFVPFPTGLLAEHLRGPDAQAAAFLYGGTLTVVAVLFNMLWLYAAKGGRLLETDADPDTVRGITLSFLPGPVIYLAATLMAFISPLTSAILYAAIALFYTVESAWLGRRRLRKRQ
jgi:uncharacterized membrane protein